MNAIQCLIIDLDHNIDSNILTFGSLLFEFARPNGSFDFDKFRKKASTYIGYNEKNLCKTYEWLENNGFIYYKGEYYVSDMIRDVLREPEKLYDIETNPNIKHIKTGEKDAFNI